MPMLPAKRLLGIFFLATLRLAAQSVPATNKPPQQPQEYSKRIADLEKRLRDLESKVSVLEFSSNDAMNRLGNLEHESATFDPSTPNKFAAADSGIGLFLFSLGNAEPYLDGYKVDIQIGNLTTALVTNYSIDATWAARRKQGDGWIAWYKSQKHKTFSPTGSPLLSGQWTTVQLILPDTKPSEFGYLDLKLNVVQVSMSR